MSALPQSRRLTNAQALLMQLFDRDLPEADLLEMRRVLVKHFVSKAEQEAERVLNTTGRSAKDVEQTSAAINENRADYLHQLRAKA